jgi:hypothetical protein
LLDKSAAEGKEITVEEALKQLGRPDLTEVDLRPQTAAERQANKRLLRGEGQTERAGTRGTGGVTESAVVGKGEKAIDRTKLVEAKTEPVENVLDEPSLTQREIDRQAEEAIKQKARDVENAEKVRQENARRTKAGTAEDAAAWEAEQARKEAAELRGETPDIPFGAGLTGGGLDPIGAAGRIAKRGAKWIGGKVAHGAQYMLAEAVTNVEKAGAPKLGALGREIIQESKDIERSLAVKRNAALEAARTSNPVSLRQRAKTRREG